MKLMNSLHRFVARLRRVLHGRTLQDLPGVRHHRPLPADQVLPALPIWTSVAGAEDPLTLTVLGHQIVRAPEAYGVLLRTQELGDVVFALPLAIVRRLATDLGQLASSPPELCKPDGADAAAKWRDRARAHAAR